MANKNLQFYADFKMGQFTFVAIAPIKNYGEKTLFKKRIKSPLKSGFWPSTPRIL
jgi:hypothetical protein